MGISTYRSSVTMTQMIEHFVSINLLSINDYLWHWFALFVYLLDQGTCAVGVAHLYLCSGESVNGHACVCRESQVDIRSCPHPLSTIFTEVTSLNQAQSLLIKLVQLANLLQHRTSPLNTGIIHPCSIYTGVLSSWLYS